MKIKTIYISTNCLGHCKQIEVVEIPKDIKHVNISYDKSIRIRQTIFDDTKRELHIVLGNQSQYINIGTGPGLSDDEHQLYVGVEFRNELAELRKRKQLNDKHRS